MRVAEQDAGGQGSPIEATEATDDLGALAGEVRHSLGNHLHRLNYWLEVLGTEPLSDEGREALQGTAAEIAAVKRLAEGTVALCLPLELARITMDAEEVVGGVEHALRRRGATVEREPTTLAGCRVVIDGGHISRTIEIVGDRLGAGATRPVAVTLRADRDDDGRLVLTMQAEVSAVDEPDEVEALLEWGQAQRMIRRLGGALLWETAGSERRVVLLLPAAE